MSDARWQAEEALPRGAGGLLFYPPGEWGGRRPPAPTREGPLSLKLRPWSQGSLSGFA